MGTRKSVPHSSDTPLTGLLTGQIACNKQTDVHSQDRSVTTIGMLVDDVLLQIFDFHGKIYSNPRHWHPRFEFRWRVLVHVCRRWRQIIFDSPSRLNLRIFCTHRTPVRKNLGIWPAFPIYLWFAFPTSKDEDNVIAALEHCDRVHTVRLSATGSQIGKIAVVMQESFPLLTRLHMDSGVEDAPILTTEFLGGHAPRLQEVTFERIPFPALPTLLLSTSDLVTLKLFQIPTAGYISPKRMVDCLASLPRLEELAITYQDVTSRPRQIHPPPISRPVLPALLEIEFEGAFEYLEDLIIQIDSPQLEFLSTNYLELPDDLHITEVSDFINRSIGPELTPPRHAYVCFHYHMVVISFDYPHASYPGCNRCSGVSLESSDWDLPDVADVLSKFSAAHCITHLELHDKFEKRARERRTPDAYDVAWPYLFSQFPAMRTLYASWELGEAICFALKDITAETLADELPSLGLICLEGVPASSLEKIVAIRQFSDHPITVVETKDEFYSRLKSYLCR